MRVLVISSNVVRFVLMYMYVIVLINVCGCNFLFCWGFVVIFVIIVEGGWFVGDVVGVGFLYLMDECNCCKWIFVFFFWIVVFILLV